MSKENNTSIINENGFCPIVKIEYDGKVFEKVGIKDAVAGLVLSSDGGRVLLVKQYRPALRRYTLECAAGCVDYDANINDIMTNEIKEETGIDKKYITELSLMCKYHICSGISDAVMNLYKVQTSLGMLDTIEHELNFESNDEITSLRWYSKQDVKILLKYSIKLEAHTLMLLNMWIEGKI